MESSVKSEVINGVTYTGLHLAVADLLRLGAPQEDIAIRLRVERFTISEIAEVIKTKG